MIRLLIPCLIALAGAVAHAAPAPPTDVAAKDRPSDNGNGLVVSWTLSPDDGKDSKPRTVLRYEILRQPGPNSDDKAAFVKIGEQTYQKNEFVDASVSTADEYRYRVVAVGADGSASTAAESAVATRPVRQWFNERRAWFAVILVVVCGAVLYFIEAARSGRTVWIRKIAGLEAVDEAVGRATEMGRPVVFVPGIQDINSIQTVAGLTVLSRVATLTSEYDARLQVPTARSLVMSAARETVSSAYAAAGRPDAYREDDVYYLTDEQFGYVAGVTGSMVRDKPAACFYMGSFFAESLFLAETGNSIGAIQLAGTAEPSQLPFFVAACDYTLIGEEFFAASAYLSGEPHQLGSLKGQDFGKLVGAALLAIGCLLATTTAVVRFAKPESKADYSAYVRDNILGEKGFRP